MSEEKKKAEPEEHVRALARIWRRKKPAASKKRKVKGRRKAEESES